MKSYNKIYKFVICGVAAAMVSGCSLDYDPLSTPSEITEGVQTDTTTAVLKDKAAAENQLKALYELFRNRQEHSHLSTFCSWAMFTATMPTPALLVLRCSLSRTTPSMQATRYLPATGRVILRT